MKDKRADSTVQLVVASTTFLYDDIISFIIIDYQFGFRQKCGRQSWYLAAPGAAQTTKILDALVSSPCDNIGHIGNILAY